MALALGCSADERYWTVETMSATNAMQPAPMMPPSMAMSPPMKRTHSVNRPRHGRPMGRRGTGGRLGLGQYREKAECQKK